MAPLYLLFEVSRAAGEAVRDTGRGRPASQPTKPAKPFLYAPAPMLFDLKSGKRRRVVQVVFGFLAFIFFISFVGFGIGSDVTGGIFDAIGLGGGNSSGDPQYEEQIEDAEAAIAANPDDADAYADLIAAYFGSAQSGITVDETTGQQIDQLRGPLRPPAGGRRVGPLPRDQAEGDRRHHRRQRRAGVRVAQRRRGRRRGAGHRGRRPANLGCLRQLALYLYAGGQFKQGDEAAEKAVAAADPAEREQTKKNLENLREQAIKYQEQLEQAQQQGGQEPGEQQLNDPFGDLGGARAPVTPSP